MTAECRPISRNRGECDGLHRRIHPYRSPAGFGDPSGSDAWRKLEVLEKQIEVALLIKEVSIREFLNSGWF